MGVPCDTGCYGDGGRRQNNPELLSPPNYFLDEGPKGQRPRWPTQVGFFSGDQARAVVKSKPAPYAPPGHPLVLGLQGVSGESGVAFSSLSLPLAQPSCSPFPSELAGENSC